MAISFKNKPLTSQKSDKPKGAGISFLKTGNAAQAALASEEARVQKEKEERGRLWRFFLRPEEEKVITFLDGDLDSQGLLDLPMFYEHGIRVAGDFTTFVCTQEHEPCPICADNERPALVGVFTVIDHTEYKLQRGENAGQVVKDQKRLFVAKRTTIKVLQKLAEKKGGLAGCTFEVSRTGDKAPAVGDMFNFVEKNDLTDIRDTLGKDKDGNWIGVPANYEHEILYRTAEQLMDMGVGKATTTIGKDTSKKLDKKALADAM